MKEGPETLTAAVAGPNGEERHVTLARQPDGGYRETAAPPETLTATMEGQFGEEYQITLVRQPNGQYKEMPKSRQTA